MIASRRATPCAADRSRVLMSARPSRRPSTDRRPGRERAPRRRGRMRGRASSILTLGLTEHLVSPNPRASERPTEQGLPKRARDDPSVYHYRLAHCISKECKVTADLVLTGTSISLPLASISSQRARQATSDSRRPPAWRGATPAESDVISHRRPRRSLGYTLSGRSTDEADAGAVAQQVRAGDS